MARSKEKSGASWSVAFRVQPVKTAAAAWTPKHLKTAFIFQSTIAALRACRRANV